MPDIELKRINALTEKTSLGDADMFAVDSASGTRKVSGETVKALIDEKIEAWAETGTVANANQLISKQGVVDHVPYFFRTSGGSKDIGDRKYEKLVGGSVGWNQLVQNGDFASSDGWDGNNSSFSVSGNVATVTPTNARTYINHAIKTIEGHKYLRSVQIKANNGNAFINWYGALTKSMPANGTWITVCDIINNTYGTQSDWRIGCGVSDNTSLETYQVRNVSITDLTAMFGSTIADYLYSLESATAGAGVAKLKSWGFCTKDYYAYDAGSMQSASASKMVTVGFNAYNPDTGKAKVVGGHEYQITGAYTALSLDGTTITPVSGKFTPSHDGELTVTGGNASTTCIHLRWSGYRDGEYEPYSKHEYALDSDLVLRGIPKLDDNHELYFDGDTYEDDGTVTRYWAERDYTSGDASDGSTMITNGTKTIYKLTTPTTETADPYTSPMVVDDFGTEEFVSTGVVPMGHDTTYPANLRDKVQHLPSPTGTAGIYAVQEDSHENLALTTLPASVAELPDAPTTDGNYVLKCAVSSGTATYSWVSES